MSRFRPRRPSPALVVSCIALIMAMGGTSYAAFSLPANSVGPKQLKTGAVRTSKIKNGAVTAAKINTTGLTVPNALQANNANNATNATNATNAANAANASHANSANSASTANTANSANSANALNGLRIVTSGSVDNPANSQTEGTVVCPSGMVVIDGGQTNSGSTEEGPNEDAIFNAGGGTDNGFIILMNNNGPADNSFTVWALCSNGSETGTTAHRAPAAK